MWNCTACGESSEEQFDLCWKCLSPRGRVLPAEDDPADPAPAAGPLPDAVPPPLPEEPPALPCVRCGSARVITDLPLPGLVEGARVCTECGCLELSEARLMDLWESWVQARTPPPLPSAPFPVVVAGEWQEQTRPPQGARIVVEAAAGSASSFDAWLPLRGLVGAVHPDAGAGPAWLLVQLDKPFAPTLRTGISQRYLRLEVAALLVQADLGAGRDPRAWRRAEATVIPLTKDRLQPGPTVAVKDYAHAFRAVCTATRTDTGPDGCG